MSFSSARSKLLRIPFLKNSPSYGAPATGEKNQTFPSEDNKNCFEVGQNEDQVDEVVSEAGVSGRVRDVGTIQLIFISFFLTAGGPFGVEDCISSCGVAPTLIGIVVAPFLYVLPQVAMTAELSTMMPENGSFVVWVSRGCGSFWGWINGFNSLLCNTFDNAIYPVLVMDYWLRLYPESLRERSVLEIKMGIVLAGAFINIFRVRIIANISGIFTCVVLSPFILGFCWTIIRVYPSQQWTWSPPAGEDHRDWAAFLSTLLWLHTGWDGISSVAGEVKDGSRSFIKAVIICAIMNCFVYLTAIISAATVSTRGMLPDDIWSDGYLLTANSIIFPRFGGVCVAIVSAIDNICMYFIGISTISRGIMKMADDGRDDKVNQNKMAMMPGFMGWEWKKTSSPAVAVLVQSLLVMFLIQFDFTFLVEVDAFANSICLLLEFVAFIRLRYTEPTAKRPYRVPGGMCVAWAMTLAKLSIVVTIIIFMAQKREPLICIGIFNIIITIIYFVRVKLFSSPYPTEG